MSQIAVSISGGMHAHSSSGGVRAGRMSQSPESGTCEENEGCYIHQQTEVERSG
jgi:hypothetical protein